MELSPHSRYERFLAPIYYLSPSQIQDMVTVAPGRFVLLALDGDTVVGHVIASYTDEPNTVEVGLAVADTYQQRGIGKRLFRELADALAAAGSTKVCCHVLSDNYFVLNWLRRSMRDVRMEQSCETMTVHASFLLPTSGQRRRDR